MRRLLSSIAARTFGPSGFVADELTRGALVGAAWLSRGLTSRPAAVELCVDGETKDVRLANQSVKFADGTSEEKFGFSFPIDKVRLGIEMGSRIDVRVANTSVSLTAPKQKWPMTVAKTPYFGAVDIVRGSLIKGWAYDSKNDDIPLKIDIVCDGGYVSTVTCRLLRTDVIDSRTSEPRKCGFECILPKRIFQKRAFSLDARIAGTLISLNNSPVAIDPAHLLVPKLSPVSQAQHLPKEGDIRGSVEKIRGFFVSGWLFDRSRLGTMLDVAIYVDGAHFKTVPADIRRRDQKDATDGANTCGFSVDLPDEVFDGAYHRIDVLCADSGHALWNSPLTIGGPDLDRLMIDLIEKTAKRAGANVEQSAS